MSQFTLITGDIVSYDSNQVATINATGEIKINRFAEPLFIPDSAKAAIELGRLDDNLFNEDLLNKKTSNVPMLDRQDLENGKPWCMEIELKPLLYENHVEGIHQA